MTMAPTDGRLSMSWPGARLVRVCLVQLVAVAVVLGAGYAAGGRDRAGGQVGPFDVAALAAIASGVVNGLWLLDGRRLVGDRRRMLGELSRQAQVRPATTPDIPALPVAVPGLMFFHHAGCRLVDGRPFVTAAREAHLGSGRRPCGWCEP